MVVGVAEGQQGDEGTRTAVHWATWFEHERRMSRLCTETTCSWSDRSEGSNDKFPEVGELTHERAALLQPKPAAKWRSTHAQDTYCEWRAQVNCSVAGGVPAPQRMEVASKERGLRRTELLPNPIFVRVLARRGRQWGRDGVDECKSLAR